MATTPEEVAAKIDEVVVEGAPKDEPNNTQEVESQREIEQVEETAIVSEVEKQARAAGWRPKEEWEGDPEDWVSPKEFVRRGEYFNKIHNQNRQIKKLEKALQTMADHHKRVFDAAYNKAKSELKQARIEAIKDGDGEAVQEIEEHMEKLETKYKEESKQIDLKIEEEQQAQQQQQPPPEYTNWVKDNQWFVKEPALRRYAESVGIEYAMANPQATNVEVYDYVTQEVRQRFPEKFTESKSVQKRKAVQSVEGDSPRGRSPKPSVDLTPEEEHVARTLIARGLYKDKAEYYAELKKAGLKK